MNGKMIKVNFRNIIAKEFPIGTTLEEISKISKLLLISNP